MATQAQILANRSNAQASTGPTSPEGKSAASKNATRHGLSAAFQVLPHESRDEFEELEAAYHSEFNPQGPHESFLVGEMIQARWKLARIERLEAAAFEQILTEPGSADDPDSRILNTLSRSGNPLDKLQRYDAAANRAYNSAHRQLLQTRAAARKDVDKSAQAFIQQYLNTEKPPKSAPLQNEPKPAARPAENLALRL